MKIKEFLTMIRIKRFNDLLFSLILILMLLPLFLIIAIGIKLDSAGPVFYCSIRVGRYAKPFHYFKFRSMYVGTINVTKFGRFIRRWHLDELPELFLVFIGKMSLVGPRPMPRGFILRMHKAYYASLKEKPGMTGAYQIRRSGRKTIEHIIFLNNWYAEKKCFLTDFHILRKTPRAILKQKNGTNESVKID